jgi:phage major head subunit gpT-like protein
MPITGINPATTGRHMFVAFSSKYLDGYKNAAPQFREVSETIPMGTRTVELPILGNMVLPREWIGAREVQSLELYDYKISAKKFELTYAVNKDHVEDDQLGIVAGSFRRMGKAAALHNDYLVFEALNQCRTALCYDGTPFCGISHPRLGGLSDQSNFIAGDNDLPWYLMASDEKPIQRGLRRDYAFKAKTRDLDDNVFDRDEFLYGTDARIAIGYGMPWGTICSGREIPRGFEAADVAAVHAAIQEAWLLGRGWTDDRGQPMGLNFDTIVAPTPLYWAFKNALESPVIGNGRTNNLRGMFRVIESPRLSTATIA